MAKRRSRSGSSNSAPSTSRDRRKRSPKARRKNLSNGHTESQRVAMPMHAGGDSGTRVRATKKNAKEKATRAVSVTRSPSRGHATRKKVKDKATRAVSVTRSPSRGRVMKKNAKDKATRAVSVTRSPSRGRVTKKNAKDRATRAVSVTRSPSRGKKKRRPEASLSAPLANATKSSKRDKKDERKIDSGRQKTNVDTHDSTTLSKKRRAASSSLDAGSQEVVQCSSKRRPEKIDSGSDSDVPVKTKRQMLFGPETPAVFGPELPAAGTAASASPEKSAPSGPVFFGPEKPAAFGPEVPIAFGPQAPEGQTLRKKTTVPSLPPSMCKSVDGNEDRNTYLWLGRGGGTVAGPQSEGSGEKGSSKGRGRAMHNKSFVCAPSGVSRVARWLS